MLPHLLRYADRNSMAFSREVRLPFLDHRLVEFVDGLPDEAKLHCGITKRVLREAAPHVPADVRGRREKIGFAVPAADWMRGPLRGCIQDVLLSTRVRERGIFNVAAVTATAERFFAGDDGGTGDLWRLLAAESWMRAFLDPGGAAA
jgi:asparagine synthase (glutamine-hydrolysing)